MKIKSSIPASSMPGLLTILFLYCSILAMAEKVTYGDSWGSQGISVMQQGPASVSLNFSLNDTGNTATSISLPEIGC